MVAGMESPTADPEYEQLFKRVQEITRVCRSTRDALLETPDELVARIFRARNVLRDAILGDLEKKVVDAAERGLQAAVLYAFNGNEFIEDISVLYLLKGPKPLTPRLPDGVPPPLLPELVETVTPFTLVHDWDGISGGNRILLKW